MNLPNQNPRITNPNPSKTTIVNPVKKPFGPVVEQIKQNVAQQRQASSVQNVGFWGVKPQAYAKYLNLEIKPSPFKGIAYNKLMQSLSQHTLTATRTLSTNIDRLL